MTTTPLTSRTSSARTSMRFRSSSIRTLVADGQPSLDEEEEYAQKEQGKSHQRVWYAENTEENSNEGSNENNDEHTTSIKEGDASDTTHIQDMNVSTWHDRVADRSENLHELLVKIKAQELGGGRMRTRQLGVLHEDPAQDMKLLSQNYTLPAVASALRDREDALQQAAVMASEQDWEGLAALLSIYHPKYVAEQRQIRRQLSYGKHNLDAAALEIIRKALMRMPRTVTQAHKSRAAVVVALCTVNNIPSLLLEKRAANLRAHPDEVCLPGGMVCSVADRTIVATCLREMQEEIAGIDIDNTTVLGVFRCNWGEVHHLVGVAVTPVVCFLGELPADLKPNPTEVSQVFTLPLASLLDKSLWVHKEGLAPIFLGGPQPIWGLTGYILDRFAKDILAPHSSSDTLGALGDGPLPPVL
jgi:ADP-ribose pyrophosphatase YjhB (NUDIX family)